MIDTVETITREIAELDAEFGCAENRRSGRLKLGEYTRRHLALRERLREAEKDAKRVAPVRPAVRAAPKLPYEMRADDARRMNAIEGDLARAREAGDQTAMADTLTSEEYSRLLFLNEKQAAEKFSGSGYAAATGARVALMMNYIALGVMRRKALEDRVKDLEGAIPRYCGVYRAGEAYAKNNIVTFGGSMWIALRDTTTKPPSEDWRLCVAKGRDGRDGR